MEDVEAGADGAAVALARGVVLPLHRGVALEELADGAAIAETESDLLELKSCFFTGARSKIRCVTS